MSEATVNAAIVTIIDAVGTVGVVHGRRRFARSPAEWLQLMRATSGGQVNGWTVHRRATDEAQDNANTYRREHQFEIIGVMDIDDGTNSAATFQALVEAVTAALRADYTVGGTCIDSGPAQIEEVDDVPLDEADPHTAYHVARIGFTAVERVAA